MSGHGTRAAWEIDEGDFPTDGTPAEQARFLLGYAILAPSSHNSQPWVFEVSGNEIRLFVDESRWLAVADSDKRELYLSVGCALENLLVAALRFGFDPSVEYHAESTGDLVATVTLDSQSSAPSRASGRFDAITARETNHNLFEERTLSSSVVDRLRSCVTDEDLQLRCVDDAERRAEIAALQATADEAQFDDAEYREELGYWIGTGALGANWLKARLGQVAVRHLDLGGREGAKNSKLIESAPLIGVLTSATDDRTAQIKTGQAFERIALTAADAGLAVHPMSQILELPEYRRELAFLLELGDATPQHLFRVGYAESDSVETPRRPVAEVLR